MATKIPATNIEIKPGPRKEGFAIVRMVGERDPKVEIQILGDNLTPGLAVLDNYTTYHEELEGEKTFRTVVREHYEQKPQETCYKMMGRNAMIRSGLQRKAEFSATGFKIWSKTAKQRDACKQLARALNLDAFELQHHYHLQTVDMALPWWQEFETGEPRPAMFPTEKEAKRCPKWLEFINPRIAVPLNGPNKIALRPWLDTYYTSRKIPFFTLSEMESDKIEIISPEGSPDFDTYLRKTAQLHQDVPIDILEKRFRIYCRPSYRWTKLSWENWPRPSMLDVLPDIEYLEMCAQVDQNTLAQTKAGIIQYGIGPDSGEVDIEKNPPPTQQEVDELSKLIKDNLQNRMPMYIGRNDLTIKWAVPPVELFMQDKYFAAMGRVMDWIGLPGIFWPVGFFGPGGKSEAYASAYIAIKPFRAHLEAMRRTTRRWLERFLWEWCVVNDIGTDEVQVSHDQHVLLEDRQVLDTTRALRQAGRCP